MKTSLTTTLIRGADLIATPWKNGGGVTREIAAHPPGAALDAFAWRVSVAEVAAAGPFSRFPGVGRTLVLLSGAGMTLEERGGATPVSHELRVPLDVARFAGEADINATLADGATRDFNLMARRSLVRADLTVWRDGGFDAEGAQTVLLFSAQGQARITLDASPSRDAVTHALDAFDTLLVDRTDAAREPLHCTLQGEGAAVLAIRIHALSD